MLSRLRLPLTAAALALAVAGCGGDGDDGDTRTFEDPEFRITFEYPAEFEKTDDVSFNREAGITAAATAGVKLDNSNLIALQRFNLRAPVTPDNLEQVKDQADRLFSQIAGRRLQGRSLKVAGLSALQYEYDVPVPRGARTRDTAIFDGSVEYLVNCQSTPAKRDEINDACTTALRTLKRR